MGKCQLQRSFAENIHHHEVKTMATIVNILAIILSGQLVHVVANRQYMPPQGVFALLVCICIVVILKRLERHFRIDDDISVVGEMQNNVGNQPMAILFVYRIAVFVLHRGLLFKLQSLFQPHTFEHLLQS